MIAVLPFVLAAFADKLPTWNLPMPVFIAIQAVQTAVFIGGMTALGLILAGKTGLSLPLLDALEARRGAWLVLQRIAPVSLLSGSLVGVLVVLSELALKPYLPHHPPLNIAPWKGLLASLYGGIDEEIVMRLFLMSLVAWLFGLKWRSTDGRPSQGVLLAANLLVALVFGLGHLPAAARVTTSTPALVAMVVGLNSLGGLLFGYLYARRGLEAAMIAHFSGDVIIHFVGPMFFH
jgi:membrane protease YdiL (CAAX protease family)